MGEAMSLESTFKSQAAQYSRQKHPEEAATIKRQSEKDMQARSEMRKRKQDRDPPRSR